MPRRHSTPRLASGLAFAVAVSVSARASAARVDPDAVSPLPAPPVVTRWSLERQLETLWKQGLRDDTRRATPQRSRIIRSSAAGLGTGAGLSLVVAGLSGGERRSGAAAPMPVWGAGAHTGNDLAFVIGATTLLGSALLASVPLHSGVRRLRPTPIGGKRWGGVAVKWRF